MILFAAGAALVALGVVIIYAVRSPEDEHLPRNHIASLKVVLLSNFVLVLIMTGGTLMALAIL